MKRELKIKKRVAVNKEWIEQLKEIMESRKENREGIKRK